ncbi:MAG: DUF2235 domain-containing protein, partial [Deltaproteobacteria bacterium]|nr:DUF2235 domain-containing protein [Deltaproteobacteria bacterium]
RRYKDKTNDWHPKGPKALAFRQQNTWGNETIRFLGVFDTVGALGAPFGIVLSWIVDKIFGCSFHDTQLSSIIQSAYHALAIDERRLPFCPTFMQPNTRHDSSNFEEKWFPGVHSDVGGGYSSTGLSDLVLDWMAKQATHHGLNLNLQRITNPPFEPNVKEPPHNSQTVWYQLPSVLLVKLPGCIGLVPKKYKAAIPNLQWTGDYIRPIPGKGDVKPFIKTPPEQNIDRYKGSLHACVIEKIKQGEGQYQPPNVC